MSPREGIFYAGWMGGIILCVLGGQLLNFHRILCLLAGVVIGAIIGAVLQKVYDAAFGPKTLEQTKIDEDKCSNAYCDWTGPKGQYGRCPKCGSEI